MDKKNILEELLNLVNSAEIKNAEKFSFGLKYKLDLEDDIYILSIEIRDEINRNIEEKIQIYNKDIKGEDSIHKIYFNTIYELIKYIMWIKYNIELLDIFNLEKEVIEFINLNFYEDKNINEALREIFVAIRNNEEMEEIAMEILEEIREKEDEIDDIFQEINTQELEDIVIEKSIYSDDVYCNNCGYVWDNITDFGIIDFKIKNVKESTTAFYSIDVKFQIESYIEDSNIINYYDVEIPNFLIFPSEIRNDDNRRILKNNLLLLYNMKEDTVYSMILKEFLNFKEYAVTISNTTNVMKLENFKEEAFSELAKHLVGLFYVGSNNVYMEDDVVNLCNEFMKRSFFEFKKYLFSEFVISSTGIRVNDLNTINSFYTMIENISLRFEKEKENEKNEN